jgi:hypothetical protein
MSDDVLFDSQTPENLKIVPISDKAFRLWFNAACYCRRNLTDGRVPTVLLHTLSRTGSRRVVDELLNAGLLEASGAPHTLLVHDYLEHNPSRAEVEEERRQNRQRVATWRERRGQKRAPGRGDVTHYEQRTNSISNGERNADKPISDKESRSSELEKATKNTLLVCDSLAAQILERDPQADVSPRSERWLREGRLLLERDGRTIEQVMAVLAWLRTDDFWPTVVLSMPKFREKFTQLLAKRQASSQKVTNGSMARAESAEIDAERLEAMSRLMNERGRA